MISANLLEIISLLLTLASFFIDRRSRLFLHKRICAGKIGQKLQFAAFTINSNVLSNFQVVAKWPQYYILSKNIVFFEISQSFLFLHQTILHEKVLKRSSFSPIAITAFLAATISRSKQLMTADTTTVVDTAKQKEEKLEFKFFIRLPIFISIEMINAIYENNVLSKEIFEFII